MTYEDIIREILFYLPNWGLAEDKNDESHPAYIEHDKHHGHRKGYGEPSKPINPFVTSEDQVKEIRQYKVRNTVTREEVLHAHRIATSQALQYMNRDSIPETTNCYDAVCMWAAGILEKKYHFKETGDDNDYHPLNLIRDAKSLLDPYIVPYFRVLKSPRNTPRDHGVHSYPPPYYDPFFRDGHQGHHKKPRCPKRHSLPFPPATPDGHLLAIVEIDPLEYSLLGDKVTLNAKVWDVWGNTMNSGIVTFYVVDDEDLPPHLRRYHRKHHHHHHHEWEETQEEDTTNTPTDNTDNNTDNTDTHTENNTQP